MPLLRLKQFKPEKPPKHLKPQDEVFLCKLTGEVFTDYEAFYKRIILCNSLVWGCEVSGKTNMTYDEALQNEKALRKSLSALPYALKMGMLYCVHHTRRSKLQDLTDEIFEYFKTRFQMDEKVEIKLTDRWFEGIISELPYSVDISLQNRLNSKNPPQVNPSTQEKLKAFCSILTSLKSKSPLENKELKPDTTEMSYKVLVLTGPKKGEAMVMKGKVIRRMKKSGFNRDKVKFFLKETSFRSTASSEDGHWIVKAREVTKYELGPSLIIKQKNFFAAVKSKKNKTVKAVPRDLEAEKKKQEELKAEQARQKAEQARQKEEKRLEQEELKEKKRLEQEALKEKKRLEQEALKEKKLVEEKLLREQKLKEKEEEKARRKEEEEEKRRKREEEKARQKVEREKERERERILNLEKKNLALDFEREFKKTREDLLLEDSKQLAPLTSLDVIVDENLIGDAVMVVEFVNTFGSLYELQEEVEAEITLPWLQEALCEHDAEGNYFTILKFLLHSYLRLDKEENKEDSDDDEEDSSGDEEQSDKEKEKDEAHETVAAEKFRLDQQNASSNASAAAAWSMLHQGMALSEISIEPFSLTEVLRLHILSSGIRLGGNNDWKRWQSKGQYQLSDDPCVTFRRQETKIMTKLACCSVYDLHPAEKLKLLCVMCDQLLMLSTTREFMDDAFDKVKSLRRECRELLFEENRRKRKVQKEKHKEKLAERKKVKEEAEIRKQYGKDIRTFLQGTDVSVVGGQSKDKENNIAVQSNDSKENIVVVQCNDENKENISVEKVGSIEIQAVDKSNPEESEKPDLKEMQMQELEKKREKEQREIQQKLDQEKKRKAKEEEELKRREKEAKEEKEEQVLQNEYSENEHKLLKDIAVHTGRRCLNPLGRDRYFRRYWKFNHVDGVLIENEDADFFPSESESEDEGENEESKQENEEIKHENSDGGDLVIDIEMCNGTSEEKLEDVGKNTNSLATISKVKFEDIIKAKEEGVPSLTKLILNRYGCIHTERSEDLISQSETLSQFMTNIKDGVHTRKDKNIETHAWSCISDSFVYDSVLSSLNLRGSRENELHSNLSAIRTEFLDSSQKKIEPVTNDIKGRKGDKNEIDKNLFETMDDYTEGNLRDYLLEIEERLWIGGIGVVKCDDRDCWRAEIEEGMEKLIKCDKAKGKNKSRNEEQKEKTTDKNSCEDSGVESQGSCSDGGIIPVTADLAKPAVKELSQALLMIERGIESKYLKPPLGETEEVKIERKKEMLEGKGKNEETSKEDASTTTCMSRWEASLVECISFAQIFIHLDTLDRSILWDKSIQNTKCRICRRKGDENEMLLCDGCDRGFHMSCLKPKLKKVPEGDWFCHDCRPIVIKKRSRKVQLKVREESEGEQTEESSEDEEGSESSESESDEDADEDDGEDSDASGHEDRCTICNEEGTLILCDACPRTYHKGCCHPIMKRIPQGRWNCQICSGKDKELHWRNRAITLEKNRKKEEFETKGKSRKKGKKKESTNSQKGSAKKRSSLSTTTTEATRKRNSTSDMAKKRSSLSSGDTKTAKKVKVENDVAAAPLPSSKRLSGQFQMYFKQCKTLVNNIFNQDEAEDFLASVDTQEVPDYLQFIDTPMDFGTIKRKLNTGKYDAVEEFFDDIHLVFSNCEAYNPSKSRVFRDGVKLKAYISKRRKELGLDDI